MLARDLTDVLYDPDGPNGGESGAGGGERGSGGGATPLSHVAALDAVVESRTSDPQGR